MDAEIYGITPNAKMDALENEPPANMLSNPSNPSLACWSSRDAESTPGITINEPIL